MKLTGWRELARNLQQLPDELQPRLVTEALMDAAEPMLADAIALAPDAEPIGEGLPALIVMSDKLAPSQNGEEPAVRKDEVRIYIGNDVERPGVAGHAHLVEFGTGPRYQENGKYVGQMPAQPFLRPAFDSNAALVIRRLAAPLGRLIEAAARRLNRRSL